MREKGGTVGKKKTPLPPGCMWIHNVATRNNNLDQATDAKQEQLLIA